MLHELWVDEEGLDTFCLAGPMGDEARAMLTAPARLVWTVEARSHTDAMTKYYAYRGRGQYVSSYPEWDDVTYREHGWE